MKASTRSRAEWVRLVKELGESCARAVEFAALRGLNARTLAWWEHRLRREAAEASQRTTKRPGQATLAGGPAIRVVQVVSASVTCPPIPTAGDAPDVTVDIGRARVSVRRGVDAATLATVLAALGFEGAR